MQSGLITPTYLRPFTTLTSAIRSYLLPLIDRVAQKPDLASILLVLLILFLSLKILNMLWQAVMFWVRLATRIIFWGGAAVIALWIANRGVDGAVEDMQHWSQVWTGEYQHWKDRSQSVKAVHDTFRAGAKRGR